MVAQQYVFGRFSVLRAVCPTTTPMRQRGFGSLGQKCQMLLM